MSEITTGERIERAEVLLTKLESDVKKLRIFDELDAVVTLIFDELQNIEERIKALENNIAIVKETIATANG